MNIFDKLDSDLKIAIKKMGITTPTEIQEQSIPAVMEGKDVIGESATGSGKTLAFGCGVMNKVVKGEGLQALIMTPTRELAEQVKQSIAKLSNGKYNILSIYGGVSINPQIDELPRTDIVVGTPGRLLDHIERRTIDLSKVKIVVLDEADRMLDMGFIDDVEDILKNCPKERQNLFFSATMTAGVKELGIKFTNDSVKVKVNNQVDPSKLKQIYYNIDKQTKLSLLVHLVKNEDSGLIMVFCNSRKTVDFVTKSLKKNNINSISIHGGLTQNKRTKTIELFNGAKVGVLVCTDVAARGLHIDNVSHIYNYDIPRDSKDYVHRIGRTARAGEKGKVINLLCEYDYDNFGRIQHDYSDFVIARTEAPKVQKVIVAKSESRRGNFTQRNRMRARSY